MNYNHSKTHILEVGTLGTWESEENESATQQQHTNDLVNQRNPIMATDNVFSDAKNDNSDSIQAVLEDNSPDELNDVGLTGLHICGSNGALSSACAYLKSRASVALSDRESGWTALHRSLYGGHLKVSLLLVKCGALLDCEDLKDFSIRDKEGLTPMDLLSLKLSNTLQRSRIDMKSSAVWSFGKADFILGVPLPKASDVVPPRRIDILADKCIVQVNASKYHSCAVTSVGEVYTWGHGRDGRLGHGNEASQPEPQLVTFLSRRQVFIHQIASGESHTIAVSSDGDVYTWGSDRFGQLGHGNTLSNRSAVEGKDKDEGGKHVPHGERLLVPKRVEALRRDVVLEVAAGDAHCLCHTRDGSLYAWGSNSSGQLGLKPTELNVLPGGTQGVNIPKKVYIEALCRGRGTTTSGHAHPGRIVQLAAAHNNSMLLCFGHSPALTEIKTAKEVYQWGHGIFRPTRVMFKEPKTRALSVDGKVRSGFNPVGHHGLVNIAQVAAGQHHFAGLSADGLVYTWSVEGAGLRDHAGTSIGPERKVERVDQRVDGRSGLSPPQLVKGLLSENGGGWVASIAVTSNQMCAVTNVGDLYTWRLDCSSACASEDVLPRRVAGVKRAVSVSGGADHTLVLSAYSLPSLPLANHALFAEACPQTGAPFFARPHNHRTVAISPTVEKDDDDETDGNENEHETGPTPAPLPSIKAQSAEGVEDFCTETHSDEETVPSLQALCQREVAKTVTIKTVLSALSFAEQFHATLLEEYCTNLMSLNFDAVLAQTKLTDIDRYVESWGLGDFPARGKIRSGSALGLSAPGSSSNASSSAHPNKFKTATAAGLRAGEKTDRKFSAGSFDLTPTKVKKELPNTVEDVQKQMRAVKKKLSAIAELDEKVKADSAYLLSAEQKDKMSKRKELFAEYAHLEQLLVRCQVRERAAEKAQPEDRSNVSTKEAHSTTTTTTTTTTEKAVFPLPLPATVPSTVDGSVTLIQQLSAHETIRASPAPKSDPVPQVKSAKKGKVKGISLQEFNTILESSSTTARSGKALGDKVGKAPGDFAAWGRSLEASKATTSAPASATPSAGSSVWGAKSAPAAVDVSEANASNSKAAPPVPPPVSPAVSTDSPLKKAPMSTSDTEIGAPRRTRALLDFMPAAAASVKGLTPVTPPSAKAGWAAAPTALSSTATATTPMKTVASSPSHPVTPIRFSDIQRTEETARQTSTIATLQGNSRPWFVERHQRAASIEEVVRQQALDRAEEEEIARAVAEIDRVSLLAAKAQATKLTTKGGKAEGNKSNKKKKQSIAGGAATKK